MTKYYRYCYIIAVMSRYKSVSVIRYHNLKLWVNDSEIKCLYPS